MVIYIEMANNWMVLWQKELVEETTRAKVYKMVFAEITGIIS